MRRNWSIRALLAGGLAAAACAGCGTTRMTDTTRSATEMLLVSQAIDRSINQLDFTPMAGKQVFFEEKVLDGVTDKNYLASSLRAKMLADGCLLAEDKKQATFVVEARAGCVGTDKQSVLVGVPQMNLPTVLPGQPPMIPEIPLIKSTDQQGVAKVLVFAYNRTTGQAVWQSGVQESVSRAKDTWVCGAGPFQKGSITKHMEGPIDQLDVLGVMNDGKTAIGANGRTSVTQAAMFTPGDKATDKPAEIQPVSASSLPPLPPAPKAGDPLTASPARPK